MPYLRLTRALFARHRTKKRSPSISACSQQTSKRFVSLPNRSDQRADWRSQKASLLEKSRMELQGTKRQCELVKSLLADATAENEMMYEVGQTLIFDRQYSATTVIRYHFLIFQS